MEEKLKKSYTEFKELHKNLLGEPQHGVVRSLRYSYVAKEMYGEFSDEMNVHHTDGNSSSDNPGNLVVLPKTEHETYHKQLKRLSDLKADYKKFERQKEQLEKIKLELEEITKSKMPEDLIIDALTKQKELTENKIILKTEEEIIEIKKNDLTKHIKSLTENEYSLNNEKKNNSNTIDTLKNKIKMEQVLGSSKKEIIKPLEERKNTLEKRNKVIEKKIPPIREYLYEEKNKLNFLNDTKISIEKKAEVIEKEKTDIKNQIDYFTVKAEERKIAQKNYTNNFLKVLYESIKEIDSTIDPHTITQGK